ncbi:fimbrial protein [Citrobacter portucalensis]|uniref:fimbrial protein n=1 Tax=Citrobacter portucalensis TaxID=1639133 RepID=UPI003C2FA384
MKTNKLASALILSMGMIAAGANAADQGHGQVTFKGSIIDAPCSITPESADQSVPMGQIASHVLQGGKQSLPKAFSIDLENCEFSSGEEYARAAAGNSVTVTFSGTSSVGDPTMLGLNGEAAGAGIVIADESGKVMPLGNKSSLYRLTGTNPSLGFTAYLKGLEKATIVPGDFESIAQFSLDYQ